MVNTISKPFTFYSNTYAKAAEVNADFDELYKGTNACINQVNKNETDIANMSENKASLNGDASEVFNVANATATTHAVNLATLEKMSLPSRGYIFGGAISRGSNTTFSVASGKCYDSTLKTPISWSAFSGKTISSQAPNTVYYIYIVSDDTGATTDVVASTSSSTPQLPTGYTKYRRIGYLTTNNSGNITAGAIISFGDITSHKEGSWVVVESGTLFSSTAIGTYTFSLKNYLPKDGGVYEVIFTAQGGTGANSTAHLYWDTVLTSDNVGFLALWDKQGGSADGGYGCNTFMIPCKASTSSSTVNITVRITGAAWSSCAISAWAYRKVY